jgi:hypothetical protein
LLLLLLLQAPLLPALHITNTNNPSHLRHLIIQKTNPSTPSLQRL